MKDQRPTFDRMERPKGRVTLEGTNLSKSLSECTKDPTKLDDRSTWIRGIGRFYQERGTPLSKQTSLMKINGLDGLIRPEIGLMQVKALVVSKQIANIEFLCVA